MERKPTLRGIKKVQQLAVSRGISLSVFQQDICVGVSVVVEKTPETGGRTSNLDEMIQQFGEDYEISNVRLMTDDGDRFIQFIEATNIGIAHTISAVNSGTSFVVYYGPAQDWELRDFVNSIGIQLVVSEKTRKPSLLHRLAEAFS